MHFRVRIWSRLLTVAALALLVAGIVAPGQSRAACGDYVTVGGKKAPMAAHDTAPLDAPKPCHGPNCSQTPTAPLLPPAPPPTVTASEWAELMTRLADALPTGRRLTHPDPAGQPVQNPTSIFHPPRAGD